MTLKFYPVVKNRWSHFEQLFEYRGGPHNCWCMAWRTNENEKSTPGKQGKKISIKSRVEQGIPVGLLAYEKEKPIAWCSIAPRETYKPLGGDVTKENVWSLTCFYIKREFRKKGFSSLLLDAAIKYASASGADYVEAYPVDPDSPSYRFMGFRRLFEDAGFQFVKKAGKRRNVMLLKLQ